MPIHIPNAFPENQASNSTALHTTNTQTQNTILSNFVQFNNQQANLWNGQVDCDTVPNNYAWDSTGNKT
uniref:C-type lectin domain-containing protein n=1 Tax=Rhabditophanes sp. KR3021 TaxID=114890 RepID=A0AC35UCT5_9BILA